MERVGGKNSLKFKFQLVPGSSTQRQETAESEPRTEAGPSQDNERAQQMPRSNREEHPEEYWRKKLKKLKKRCKKLKKKRKRREKKLKNLQKKIDTELLKHIATTDPETEVTDHSKI